LNSETEVQAAQKNRRARAWLSVGLLGPSRSGRRDGPMVAVSTETGHIQRGRRLRHLAPSSIRGIFSGVQVFHPAPHRNRIGRPEGTRAAAETLSSPARTHFVARLPRRRILDPMTHHIISALTAIVAKATVSGPLSDERIRSGLARASKGAWLLRHPRAALGLVQVFASPNMRPLIRIEPRLMFKCLGNYLATNLSREERVAILTHHYNFITRRTHRSFLENIIENQLELWQLCIGERNYQIQLSFPRTPYTEGDLTLTFEVNGKNIYTLSFTIGPG